MNKKGFTLIEIMVVLVILVSLTIGGIFGINEIQNKSKDKALKELYTKVETAADVYLSMNEGYAIDLLNGKTDEKCLKLYTLQNESLLSRDLVNPYTNKKLDGDSCVISFLNEKGEIENNYELDNKGKTHRIDIEVVGGTSSETYKYGYTKVTFGVDFEENKEIKSVTCNGGANSSFSDKVVVINKINKDQKCKVVIDYIRWNVKINTVGGSASPSNSYVINSKDLVVTLTPNTGYNLNDLNYACNNNTEFSLKENVLTIKNIRSDKTCNISFKKNNYTVAVNITGGSIAPSSVIAEHGSTKEFIITPSTGYILSGASTTCTGGTINNNKLTISNITKNETCSVTLQKQKYTVNLTVVNGSGSSSKTVEHGSNTSFTGVSPNSGYTSNGVSINCINGTLSGSTLTIRNITNSQTCTVTFPADRYMAYINVTNGSAISPVVFNAGKNGSFTTSPNANMALKSYSCTNHTLTYNGNNSFTITRLSSNTTCTITYGAETASFAYQASNQSYTVPYTGYYLLTAYGAQGSGSGGKGGEVSAYVKLNKGETLVINTGGTNGYNGGGSGLYNGGGSTTIKRGGTNLIVAAGGGGGASGTAGGNGNASGGAAASSSGSGTNGGAGASGTNGGGGGSGYNYTYYTRGSCIRRGESTCNSYSKSCSSWGNATCGSSRCDSPNSCYNSGTGNRYYCAYCKSYSTTCNSWSPGECLEYSYNERTISYNSGNGGSNSIVSGAISVKNNSGINAANGRASLSYYKENL